MSQPKRKQPTLREVLLAKLGHPDRRRLHRLANAARRRYGPMSRDDTYAVLADEHGIKLHRFLVEPELGRVRTIIAAGRGTTSAPADNGRRARGRTEMRLKEIVIDGAAHVMDDPIVPPRVAEDAKRMARVYPLTYRIRDLRSGACGAGDGEKVRR